MAIVIRVMEIFWAIIGLLGVILVSSGFVTALGGLINFGTITLANAAALSHISGGIVESILGLVVVAAGYFGIRGRIIITK